MKVQIAGWSRQPPSHNGVHNGFLFRLDGKPHSIRYYDLLSTPSKLEAAVRNVEPGTLRGVWIRLVKSSPTAASLLGVLQAIMLGYIEFEDVVDDSLRPHNQQRFRYRRIDDVFAELTPAEQLTGIPSSTFEGRLPLSLHNCLDIVRLASSVLATEIVDAMKQVLALHFSGIVFSPEQVKDVVAALPATKTFLRTWLYDFNDPIKFNSASRVAARKDNTLDMNMDSIANSKERNSQGQQAKVLTKSPATSQRYFDVNTPTSYHSPPQHGRRKSITTNDMFHHSPPARYRRDALPEDFTYSAIAEARAVSEEAYDADDSDAGSEESDIDPVRGVSDQDVEMSDVEVQEPLATMTLNVSLASEEEVAIKRRAHSAAVEAAIRKIPGFGQLMETVRIGE